MGSLASFGSAGIGISDLIPSVWRGLRLDVRVVVPHNRRNQGLLDAPGVRLKPKDGGAFFRTFPQPRKVRAVEEIHLILARGKLIPYHHVQSVLVQGGHRLAQRNVVFLGV